MIKLTVSPLSKKKNLNVHKVFKEIQRQYSTLTSYNHSNKNTKENKCLKILKSKNKLIKYVY